MLIYFSVALGLLSNEVGEWEENLEENGKKISEGNLGYLQQEISHLADDLRGLASREHEQWLDSIHGEVCAKVN